MVGNFISKATAYTDRNTTVFFGSIDPGSCTDQSTRVGSASKADAYLARHRICLGSLKNKNLSTSGQRIRYPEVTRSFAANL